MDLKIIGLVSVLIGTVILSISFIPIEIRSIGLSDKTKGKEFSAIGLKYKNKFLRWIGWFCIFAGTILQIILEYITP